MHARHLYLFTTAALVASQAHAADQLKFGKPPSWVVPRAIPAGKSTESSAPVEILLHDQQIRLEPGKIVSYANVAVKVQTPEGLGAGNVSIPWDPATETVTVNAFEIHRGAQVIDILKSGQTFTTMRRESNLELAMFDGMLTANIQPEGLQEGDVLLLATTTERLDPVMKGHSGASFAAWNGNPIQFAHAKIEWPENLKIASRLTKELPAAKSGTSGGWRYLELSQSELPSLAAPTGAPARFRIGRLAEASDFQSWAEVADLMVPLYRAAGVVPATGPLRNEVEKIRSASTDPKERAARALDLVESRVRYVALLMGQGGYVPANAETTWSRRYGDCKAKTALLLGLLHALDIEAEPVMVNTESGDAIADRLPMLGHFNHVLVRARIANKDYWLDGTRTGDAAIDDLPVPSYGWGLPVAPNARLVHIVPPPYAIPTTEIAVDMDASGGVRAPAPTTVEIVFRGDSARAINQIYSAIPTAKLDEALRQKWKKDYDFVTINSSTYRYDKAKAEFRQTAKGDVKMDWRDNWFEVPGASLAYDPDFERVAGPQHDAPFTISYPYFEARHVKVRLPAGFSRQTKLPPAVNETVLGMAYRRTLDLTGNVLSVEASEKAMVPEVSYQEALASQSRIRALSRDDVYLQMPDGYMPTARDLVAMATEQPASASDYFQRGRAYMNAAKWDAAIADLSKAGELDPKDPWAPANLAIVHISKRQFDQAAKDIAAAEVIDPANGVLLHAKAMLAEAKGDHSQAVAILSTAVDKNPKDLFALFQRAGALIGTGDYSAASKSVDAIASVDPTNPGVIGLRAQIAMAKGDMPAAMALYNKAIVERPTELMWLAARAGLYVTMGEPAKALADTEAALKLDSGNSDAKSELRLMRSNLFRSMGRRADAINEADLIVKEGSKADFPFVAAARIYASYGLREKADAAFTRALTIKPAPYIYLNRAQSRPKADHGGRIADLQAALKLDENDPDVLMQMARELADQERPKEALAYYDRAEKADPSLRSIQVGRALLLAKLGRTAEAEQSLIEYRRGLKIAAEFNNLCWTKATAAVLLESALTDCQEAVRLAPDEAAFLDSLGMVYLRMGRFGDSIAAYDQALAKRPASAETLMGRALAYAGKGDMEHARADAKASRAHDATIDETFANYGLKFDDKKQ